jgi:hypothetical protein
VPGLYFISASSATVIGILHPDDKGGLSTFALSRDGRRFAFLAGGNDLEVRDVSGLETPLFVAPKEVVAIHFALLGRSCLLVHEVEEESRSIRGRCLIRWDRGRLEIERDQVEQALARLGGMLAQSRSLSPSSEGVRGSSRRFVQVIEHGTLRILIDRYNHVVVFDAGGNLVCIFYVVRDEIAALLVDGTWWGSRRLIARDAAPGAAERIARALAEAEGSLERPT